jgi:hypothetical protein
MAVTRRTWSKGKGKLGPLAPLVGTWSARASSPQGPVRCTRTFSKVLGGAYVQLTADWKFGKTRYEEIALYGPGSDGRLSFWSFTSDGKRSEGRVADVRDLHPEAVGFEAAVPAGLARMAYWPHENGGIVWVVEAQTKKGWRRITEHHYRKQ